MSGKKIYIMVGPPCSGKTTKAKSILRSNPLTIRFNRDETRIMLYGEYKVGLGYIEKLTDLLLEATLKEASKLGLSVIVDATNCKESSINKIKSIIPEGYNIEFVVLDVPFWLQRWRNIIRFIRTGIWIPREVSRRMDYNFRELLNKKL